jgi:hypothetical protein
MRLRRTLPIFLGLALAACATNAPSTASPATMAPAVPTTPGEPTPVPIVPGANQGAAPAGSPAFALRESPRDLACDAIGVEYRSVTFRIDPAASEPVTAVTDLGTTLLTHWEQGFQAGAMGELLIRDPNGQIVVKDGDVLVVPGAAWPRLSGYFVCLAPNKLFVQLQAPQ